jgi:hypothetical protein
MKAALSGGARRVVWVTLRESDPLYSRTNAAIRSAARRWPELVVADWNRASASKQWFRSDGLHLTTAGALGYARFLHAIVARAAAA